MDRRNIVYGTWYTISKKRKRKKKVHGKQIIKYIYFKLQIIQEFC